jgi:hypothetical protein
MKSFGSFSRISICFVPMPIDGKNGRRENSKNKDKQVRSTWVFSFFLVFSIGVK